MRLWRYVAGLLMLAGVAVLGGCGTRSGAPPGGLSFSTWGSLDEMEILKPILADFTRQTHIPVSLIHIPDQYPHKLRLMVAARTVPDVMFIANQDMAGFAIHGVFRDLKPFLAQDPSVKTSDFYPQALAAMSWKGTLYALPRDISNLVVFYNKDLFRQAGVPFPGPNWTVADLMKIAPRLTCRTCNPQHWAIGFQPQPLLWTPWVWSFGGDVMNPAMTRCTLDDPPARAGLDFYVDLRNRYHYAPTDTQTGNATMTQLFAGGRLAMFVYGRWAVPAYRKNLTFDWDVAPFPRGPAGSIVDADASGWAISTATRHPGRAWKLVKFLASKPSIAAFTRSGLIVPARPDVADSPDFLSGKPEHSRVFLDVIKSARPTLIPPSYDEITWDLIDDLAPAWTGQEPLDQALGPESARITELLREDSEE